MKKKNKLNYVKVCFDLLGDNKKLVIKSCIFAISATLIDLIISIFSAYYGINKALVSKNITSIVVSAVVIGALGLISVILFHISYRMSLRLVKKESKDLRERVYKKAIYLDANYFSTHSTGAMINTIIYDVATFCDGMAYNLQTILKMTIKIAISFFILTIINPKLSLILWLIAPIVAIFAYFIFKRMGKLYDIRRGITRNRLSYINEGIMGVKTVKALNLEAHEEETFKKYNKQNFNIHMRLSLLNEVFWRTFDICTYVALAVLFLRSYHFNISYGELYLYYQLFRNTLYGVGHLAGEFDYFTEVAVSGNKVYNLLYYEQLVKDKESIIDKKDALVGDIKFKNITFKYPKGEEVLKNFNLEISPNKKVAIVGKTGSGKSTIASLLYRFYEPTKGQITIDGIDYTNLSIEYIHSQIGFILQEPMLFDDTIYANLRYAKPEATDEDIEKACKLVGADEFIRLQKEGYNTKIGESGISLSNGQKQLLAFARVILKDPPIIILDEATANIDSQTENLIQQNIDKAFKNKTCLFIAHRLSTIRNVDTILYLKNGKILEQGSHQELMKLNGKYAELYNNQFAIKNLEKYLEN